MVPLANGGTHDESNLMALCKECHSRITAREGGRWGSPGGCKISK
ncbi:MAG: HNH endonuclease [Christensenellaceae bacterium]